MGSLTYVGPTWDEMTIGLVVDSLGRAEVALHHYVRVLSAGSVSWCRVFHGRRGPWASSFLFGIEEQDVARLLARRRLANDARLQFHPGVQGCPAIHDPRHASSPCPIHEWRATGDDG